jgi:hypothetical protein
MKPLSLSLLTKSHTFEDAKDRCGTYKLTEHALPNFASSKGPAFAPEHPAEPLQTTLFEKPQPQPAAKAPVPPKCDAAAQPGPKALANPFRGNPPAESLWRRATRWGKRFFSWRPIPAKPAAIVQTELGLDKVTVVRNDLSEDDVVVVTVDKKQRSANGAVETERKMIKP